MLIGTIPIPDIRPSGILDQEENNMKPGLDLKALRERLAYEHETKRDYIVNTKKVYISTDFFDPSKLVMSFVDQEGKEQDLTLNEWSLGQLAAHCKVSMFLVRDMLTGKQAEADQLAQLLTVRLNEHPSKRLVRTVKPWGEEGPVEGGEPYVRAFLDSKYLALDNYKLLQALDPILDDENVELLSAQVTDVCTYIKLGNLKKLFQVGQISRRGKDIPDNVHAGAFIINSEVGAAKMDYYALIYRPEHSNAMIYADQVYTVERGNAQQVETWDIVGQESVPNDIFVDVAGGVKKLLNNHGNWFGKASAKLTEAQKAKIVNGLPSTTVEKLGQLFQLNVEERTLIFRTMNIMNDWSQFGLVNAISTVARDVKGIFTYDRATELEALAGKVLMMDKDSWSRISENGNVKPLTRKPRVIKREKDEDEGKHKGQVIPKVEPTVKVATSTKREKAQSTSEVQTNGDGGVKTSTSS
jgi:hypothetical protein